MVQIRPPWPSRGFFTVFLGSGFSPFELYLKVFPSYASFSQICSGIMAYVIKAFYVNEHMLCVISSVVAEH